MIACIIGIAAGACAVAFLYERELARMARFVRQRDRLSNQPLAVSLPGPGVVRVADAVNAEVDVARVERQAARQEQQAFQRDLAGFAHDIRTPLAGARGFVQLACDDLAAGEAAVERLGEAAAGAGAASAAGAAGEAADAGAADARAASVRRYLAAATRRLDDMNGLLDALYVYTQAIDPDRTLHLEPIALQPALAQVLVDRFADFEAQGRAVHLSFEDQSAEILADREALARIFSNVVENALRHGRGDVDIDQRGRELRFSNAVDPAVASVIDAGRLFERFYRADPSRTTPGAGLGLASAKSLADSMGLALAASVEPGRFTITLAW
ncbi:sensor histidine kinase [Eggerthellaceae bacterium zg-886]|uniref:histidine kinase n=1 Tax=Xiamenia xianingshaonis TaxID=2682776 RepID=A0A9E6SVG0_9ACTN|nr:sensor histidine kinase [Xiamenia xianingshaonis]QTU85147.1 HAMP domain-containing histidine kinase [Xiamenia xianingshaonis]